MKNDIKIKTRDVEGLQQRVQYLDRLKDDIEKHNLTMNRAVITDSASVGYPYQVFDPSYNLDVLGGTRITGNAMLQSDLQVNGSSVFQSNVSVWDNTYLNSLTTTGNTLLQSQLQVNGSTLFQSNVSILGDTSLESDLFVNGSALFQSNVSVNGNTFLSDLEVEGESFLQGQVRLHHVDVVDEIRILPGGKLTYVSPPNIEFHTEMESTRLNVSCFGPGPALRASQQNATFSNILFLEDSGRNVYSVGAMGDTQILGKMRLGFDVISSNVSVFDHIQDIKSDISPFGDNHLEVNGNVSISGTVSIGGLLTLQKDLLSYSDRRIKKNITPLEDCLDKITHIHGYRYQRIDHEDPSYSIGLMAQEIEETYPELVTEIKVGKETLKTVNYQAFNGVLLECIQELKRRVLHLENKLLEK